MLPKASLSFTLPSIHDNANIDCRVYHPACLAFPAVPPWGRHVAIVAHPYAPLGGCYDDPVVDVVAGTLLQLGFMVATFNFRGASGGRTSWTSKPERADYVSVVGFMAYYVHYLDFPQRIATHESNPPVMLLAGYSYGAMITTKLPPLATILPRFQSPVVHSAAVEIRLRGQHLAEQQNRLFATPASPRKSLGMRVGGVEDTPRKSREIRRSHSIDQEDRIKKGVKDLLARTKLVRRKHKQKAHEQAGEVEHEVDCMESVEGLVYFRSAYLVVSPPLGIATNLATMTFPNPFADLAKRFGKANNHAAEQVNELGKEEKESEQKLIHSPSLVIYGDLDSFSTIRKLREWTTKLRSYEGSLFYDVEVAGAGHFWAEGGAIHELRHAVSVFGTELLGEKANVLKTWDGA